jgi:uncharacterized membrane protein
MEHDMRIHTSITQLRNWFLQGIALLAPLAITIAFLLWLGRAVELVMGEALRGLLPVGWYVPGMGFVAGILLTLALGLVANLFLIRWLVSLAERVVDRIPLVKSVFQALKDVARFFGNERGQRALGRPVTVEIQGLELVGFVMQDHARLPGEIPEQAPERMAVYLPMSYQLGGYTLYLDPERVKPLNVGMEHALRAVLTGGSLTPGHTNADQ